MTRSRTVEIVPFIEEPLDGVIRLCNAEGWPSFPGDPERAIRVLTAPGVTTVIALDDGAVVGFAELFSDGELQAFLANLAVDKRFAGEGRDELWLQRLYVWPVVSELICSARTTPWGSMRASPTSKSRGFGCTHSIVRAKVRAICPRSEVPPIAGPGRTLA